METPKVEGPPPSLGESRGGGESEKEVKYVPYKSPIERKSGDEAHDQELVTRRRILTESIIGKGRISNEALGKINDEIDRYMAGDAKPNNVLQHYLPSPDKIEVDSKKQDSETEALMEAFADIMTELKPRRVRVHEDRNNWHWETKSTKSLMDIVEESGLPEAARAGDRSKMDETKVAAIKMFSAALIDTYAVGKENKGWWSQLSPEERNHVRLAEVTSMILDRYSVELALKEGSISKEEAERAYKLYTRYSQNDDIPHGIAKSLQATASALNSKLNFAPEHEDVQKVDTVGGEGARKAEDDQSQKQAEAEGFEEEAVLERNRHSLIFERREVVKDRDLVEIKKGLKELYEDKDDPVKSTFQLAKQLYNLKRAEIGITKGQDKVFEKLNANIDKVFDEEGDVKGAQYLTFLKEIGSIQEVDRSYQGRMANAINDNVQKFESGEEFDKDLSLLCVNAHHLGVELDGKRIQPALERELQNVRYPEKEAGYKVALRLGRMKYLEKQGVIEESVTLGVTKSETKEVINAKEEDYRMRGKWNLFAKLRSFSNYIRGERVIDQYAKNKMLAYTETRRESSMKSEKKNRWGGFIDYIASMRSLSEQTKKEEKLRREKFVAGLKPSEREAYDFLGNLAA